MIDPKTRTIRCTYWFSKDTRCLTEATHFFRITMPRKVIYDARCGLHAKLFTVNEIEDIDRDTFIIEPVHDS